MAKLDRETAQRYLKKFVDISGECGRIMNKIKTEYIDGAEGAKKWTTPKGGEFMDAVSLKFADYNKQFNTAYQGALDAFLTQANAILRSENVQPIATMSITQLPVSMAKSWTPDSNGGYVDFEFDSFTSTFLTNNINELKGYIGQMQDELRGAVQYGFDSSFLNGLLRELDSLKTSAQSVADEYSTKAVNDAIVEAGDLNKLRTAT